MAMLASIFFILADLIELVHFVKEQEPDMVALKIAAIVSSVVMVCLSLIALMRLTGC